MKKNFWKKTAAGLMALLIVAGVSPVAPFSQVFEGTAITVSAANGDVVDSGECGANVAWTLTQNNDDNNNPTYTLTISGTGAMWDYFSNTLPWKDYIETITTVNIENGVTTIGQMAFYCYNLGSVNIPASVTNIGIMAFGGCSQLKSLTIPNSVTTIGEAAFGSCSKLQSVTILANEPPTLSDYAFYGISKAAKFYVPSASVNTYVTKWGVCTTNNTVDLYSVNISEDITTGTVTADKIIVAKDATDADKTVTLTVTPDTGYAVKSVKYNDGTNDYVIEPVEGVYSFTMPAGDVTVSAEFVEPITYLDENGVEQTCTNYTVLTGNEETLGTAGQTTWYVVKDDKIEFNHITYLNGDVHIILCDDKTMKVSPNSSESALSGLSSTLTIYGQSKGTGKLDLVSSGGSAIASHSVIINGGTVIAMGGLDCSGIYASGDVTINGGNVTAEGDSYGIQAEGDVTINGGNVTAEGNSYGIKAEGYVTINGGNVTAGNYYPGIYAGNDIILGGAEVTASSYIVKNDGAVKVKDGLIYGDEDGNIYDSDNNLDTGAIAGKTLTPIKPESLSSGTIAEQPVLHIGNSDNILAIENTYLDGYKFNC